MEFTHKDLCKIADKWLGKSKKENIRFQKFPIHVSEMVCTSVNETPDAIGWNYCSSCVIEVKVSRSDFFADRNKPFRTNGEAMGNFRYYLVPENLIKENELPEGWGLIYVDAKGRTKEIKKSDFFSLTNIGLINEKDYLYSIARRFMEANKEKNTKKKSNGGPDLWANKPIWPIKKK